jgi:hypothetical protein
MKKKNKSLNISLLFLGVIFTSVALIDLCLLDYKVENIHIDEIKKYNSGRNIGIRYNVDGEMKFETLARANRYFEEGKDYKVYRTSIFGWFYGYQINSFLETFFSAILTRNILFLCFLICVLYITMHNEWIEYAFQLALIVMILIYISKS